MIHLVTGGAGFLGSHLIEALLSDSATDRVIALDNFFTGRHQNISGFDGRLEIVRHDVCEPFHVECDRIWHLACPAAPIHYARNPARTILAAVLGTKHALDLARETGARLLLTSTSEVYGDPQVHPQPEHYRGNVDPWALRSCYDEGKRAGETLCHAYQQQWGVAVRVARVHNTYGPRMQWDDGRVVPAFLKAALSDMPLQIHSDGQQTRSFCYVDDMIDGLLRLMASSLRGPVNLGSDDEVTIYKLAESIVRLVGSRSPIQTGEAHPVGNDPARRPPGHDRAREHGWSACTSLEGGLAATIAWARASAGRP